MQLNTDPNFRLPAPVGPKSQAQASATRGIVGTFQKMFDEVNSEQIQAEKKVAEMVAGRNKDIPATMMAIEKADVSLKMFMAVRNKMVSAYEEMMRMQI